MGCGITRRSFMSAVAFGATGFLYSGCKLVEAADNLVNGSLKQDNSKKPNIIFIMADDMGFGDPGCYNPDSKIPTPNIDRLAEEGMLFTDAHSPSAVCSPTRYGVMTGRYAWRTTMKHSVLSNFSPSLIQKDRLTVASMLKQYGYATACVGKWHLGFDWKTKDGRALPENRYVLKKIVDQGRNIDYAAGIEGGPVAVGFDYFFGGAGNFMVSPYCFIENNHTVGIPSVEKTVFHGPQTPGVKVPDWEDDKIDFITAKKAVGFIKKHLSKNRQQPFFLYFTPHAPHRPCVPPDFMKGKSKAGKRGDMVAMFDWMIGQVTKTLKEEGIEENTLIFVTSDNGATLREYKDEQTLLEKYNHKSNGNWTGQKAQIWEGGHRVPFIAKWPGKIKATATSDETICLTDFMATCAAIVGHEHVSDWGEDSYNILPVLLGKSSEEPIRKAIVLHDYMGRFSIRQDNWKLLCPMPEWAVKKWPKKYKRELQYKLYNLNEDPKEQHDLSKQHPETVKKLKYLLAKYKEQGHSRT